MENAKGRLNLVLVATIVGMLLPLGTVEAKDWHPGDAGMCPGTWDYKERKCKRPYLCEPAPCMACFVVAGVEEGGKCIKCGVPRDCTDKTKELRSHLPRKWSDETAPSTPAEGTLSSRHKPVTSLGVHHTPSE